MPYCAEPKSIVNVVGTFVGLDRFQVVHVSHDWVFAGHCSVMSRATRAISSAMSTLFILAKLTNSGINCLVDFSTEVVYNNWPLVISPTWWPTSSESVGKPQWGDRIESVPLNISWQHQNKPELNPNYPMQSRIEHGSNMRWYDNPLALGNIRSFGILQSWKTNSLVTEARSECFPFAQEP